MRMVIVELPVVLLRRIKQHAYIARMRPSELMSLWIAKSELDCRVRIAEGVAEVSADADAKAQAARERWCQPQLCPKCNELINDDFFFNWCAECRAVGTLNQKVDAGVSDE